MTWCPICAPRMVPLDRNPDRSIRSALGGQCLCRNPARPAPCHVGSADGRSDTGTGRVPCRAAPIRAFAGRMQIAGHLLYLAVMTVLALSVSLSSLAAAPRWAGRAGDHRAVALFLGRHQPDPRLDISGPALPQGPQPRPRRLCRTRPARPCLVPCHQLQDRPRRPPVRSITRSFWRQPNPQAEPRLSSRWWMARIRV